MSANRKILEQLSAYLDGALAGPEAERVARAVAADPDLQRELAELSAVRDLLRGIPPERAPADLAGRVIAEAERIQLVGHTHVERTGGAMRWVRIMATAAVLLVAASVGMIVGVTLWSPPKSESEMAAGTGGAEDTAPGRIVHVRPAWREEHYKPDRDSAAALVTVEGGGLTGPRTKAGIQPGPGGEMKGNDEAIAMKVDRRGEGPGGDGRADIPDAPAGKVAGEGGTHAAPAVAASGPGVENEVLFTDRLEETRRAVERLLRDNGIARADAREVDYFAAGKALPKNAPAAADREYTYVANLETPRQVQYEAWVPAEKLPVLQEQLRSLAARQSTAPNLESRVAARQETGGTLAVAGGTLAPKARKARGAERGPSPAAKPSGPGPAGQVAQIAAKDGGLVISGLDQEARRAGQVYDQAEDKRLEGAAAKDEIRKPGELKESVPATGEKAPVGPFATPAAPPAPLRAEKASLVRGGAATPAPVRPAAPAQAAPPPPPAPVDAKTTGKPPDPAPVASPAPPARSRGGGRQADEAAPGGPAAEGRAGVRDVAGTANAPSALAGCEVEPRPQPTPKPTADALTPDVTAEARYYGRAQRKPAATALPRLPGASKEEQTDEPPRPAQVAEVTIVNGQVEADRLRERFERRLEITGQFAGPAARARGRSTAQVPAAPRPGEPAGGEPATRPVEVAQRIGRAVRQLKEAAGAMQNAAQPARQSDQPGPDPAGRFRQAAGYFLAGQAARQGAAQRAGRLQRLLITLNYVPPPAATAPAAEAAAEAATRTRPAATQPQR